VALLCEHIIDIPDLPITQRILTRLVDDKNVISMESSLRLTSVHDKTFLAMWRSFRVDKGTALWMSSYSSGNVGLQLSNEEFSDNLRTRLLLPTVDPDPTNAFTCICSPDSILPEPSKYLHHMLCTSCKQQYDGRRHFILKTALRVFVQTVLGAEGHLSASEFQLPTVASPVAPHNETALRADFRFLMGGHYRVVDVGVSTPISHSYINAAAIAPLAAASAYEKSKRAKYVSHYPDALLYPWMAHLSPFIVETTGAFGLECNKFLHSVERSIIVPAAAVQSTKSKIRKAWRFMRLTVSVRFAQLNSAQYRGTLRNLQPFVATQDSGYLPRRVDIPRLATNAAAIAGRFDALG
jgi:hypothetical protein